MSLNHFIIAAILICNFMGAALNFEVLVYNEEAIIVVCFVLFLSFAYKTIGVSISEDLDGRSSKVQDELAKSTEAWKQMQINIKGSWSSILLISTDLGLFFAWARLQAKSIASISKTSLNQALSVSMVQRLNFLLLDELSYRSSIQRDLNSSFFSAVNAGLGFSYLLSSNSSKYSFKGLNKKLLSAAILNIKTAGFGQVSSFSLNLAETVVITERLIRKISSSRI